MAKKKKSLVCFGDFIEDNEKCDTCPSNIDCFGKVYGQLECFPLALDLGQCEKQADCSNDPEKCERIRLFLKTKERKSCIGQLNQKSDECLACELLNECEVAEILILNIGIDSETIKSNLVEEINQMKFVIDNCFGEFEFDNECYEDCDFALRCRREANILPGKTCKYWKKEHIKDLNSKFPCHLKDACSSYNTCVRMLKTYHEKIAKREQKLKPFKTFQNLEEMRKSLKWVKGD